MRILYVEDDASMAKTVGAMITRAGHEVDTVACGKDAVTRARVAAATMSRKYDLILLDLMLPDIDGYAVIDRIRALRVDTPVLIQTGLLEDRPEDDGASLGVADYLIKPFSRKELISGVERALAGAGRTVEARLSRRAAVAERRAHPRFEIHKMARVLIAEPFDCIVMNISEGGAAIRLPNPKKSLPARFAMVIDSIGEVECELCWRLRDKAGVKFDV